MPAIALTDGALYRLPSGRLARFDRYVKSQACFRFLYEDLSLPVREREITLSEGNLHLLARISEVQSHH